MRLSSRGIRGGNWINNSGELSSAARRDDNPAIEISGYGFRIAGLSEPNPIPEPSSFVLLSIGAIGLIGYGWRKRKAA